MPLMPEELERLQRHARSYHAAGRSFADNPFLRMSNLPRQTGESRDNWLLKHDAWRDAWVEEEERQRAMPARQNTVSAEKGSISGR